MVTPRTCRVTRSTRAAMLRPRTSSRVEIDGRIACCKSRAALGNGRPRAAAALRSALRHRRAFGALGRDDRLSVRWRGGGMLSARAIYREIREDDRTFQLFISVAAAGEEQGGWENVASLRSSLTRN